jgi:hypothetical protein
MRRLLLSRSGDAYAWFAVLMVFVVLPLSSLSIDVVRMMYVRGHLQTANDAACQSAADALDVARFISSGEKQINPALARFQAVREFSTTLQDAGRVRYTIEGLAIDFPQPTFAHCVATVQVQHLMPQTPEMRVVVETTSEMRTLTLTP